MKNIAWSLLFTLLIGCTAQPNSAEQARSQTSAEALSTQTETQLNNNPTEITPAELGQVTNVEASGQSGAYTFAVTIASPDTGCEAYANWWEVITPEGELIYRRILAHSHVDEQPFIRSGGPVSIEADQPIIVRMHMHPTGYSPYAMKGLIGKALEPHTLSPTFAANLANAAPQPNRCTF